MADNPRSQYNPIEHAERVICGSILLNPEIAENVSLRPDEFTGKTTRQIYSAVLSAKKAGEPIDLYTIENKLKSSCQNILTDISTMVDEATGLSRMWEEYQKKIRNNSVKNKMLKDLENYYNQLKNDEVSPADVANRISVSSSFDDAVISQGDLGEALSHIEAYQTGTITARRNTGWKELDKYAPRKNELLVIAGRPSVGKTAISLALAEKYVEAGDKVLYMSLEMAPIDLIIRRACALAKIPSHIIEEKHSLSSEQWEKLSEAFEKMHSGYMHIAYSRFGLRELVSYYNKIKQISGVDVMIIDYLGIMMLPPGERYDIRIGELTSELAQMSKRENITIILLHQLNRAPESRESKRPMMSDLRDSGRIEQDADVVWLLYRDSYYDQDAEKTMDVICGKNRNGKTGTAKLAYNHETGCFGELTVSF